MTLTEISEEVARRVGSSVDEAHGFIAEAMELIAESLNAGREVSVRGLGTFKWVPVPARPLYNFVDGITGPIKAGYKLRFYPARKFKIRRSEPDVRPEPRRRNDQTGGRSQ